MYFSLLIARFYMSSISYYRLLRIHKSNCNWNLSPFWPGLSTFSVQTSHNVEKEVLTGNWSKSTIHANDSNIDLMK